MGRVISFATKGSEEIRYLKWMSAEANVGGEMMIHILLKNNLSTAAISEAFLHGTQFRLDLIDRLARQGAEVHVKDFMIRHQKLLGLADKGGDTLRILLEREKEILQRMNQ